jgi:hypothetical protein
VDPLRLTTEESPFIQPSEVVVSQRPVLTAEPVLTPIGNMISGVMTLTSDTLFPKLVLPYGSVCACIYIYIYGSSYQLLPNSDGVFTYTREREMKTLKV